MQYVFILGRNPNLSVAEILAVLPKSQIINRNDSFLILETKKTLDCNWLLDQLGGTIKIGQIIAQNVDWQIIIDDLLAQKVTGKLNFGLSYYLCQPQRTGLEIKKILQQAGVKSRLVTSREAALSSVVVTKNKCQEFLILQNQLLAKTCSVQKFEDYSQRDFGRPARDTFSGTLPPKLAKIMINLAQVPQSATILDPFCGSGTILQEALVLGYQQVVGTDNSAKAIAETKRNLAWLVNNYPAVSKDFQVQLVDVRSLSQTIKTADAIVAEPYLGPALRGHESLAQVKIIIEQLEDLYLDAFSEFARVLDTGGRVVIVFPYFTKHKLTLEILSNIEELGFTKISPDDLVYSRPNQQVWREVLVFTKD